jgi:hypothetical protein
MIPHDPDNWRKFSRVCLRCGQLDGKTGMCTQGLHHAHHANAGYCPIGDFGPGSDIPPPNWPAAEHGRAGLCRACPAHAKGHCGEDGAGVREHAREAICPQGKFPNGTTGRIELRVVPDAPQAAPAASGKGCCGGS